MGCNDLLTMNMARVVYSKTARLLHFRSLTIAPRQADVAARARCLQFHVHAAERKTSTLVIAMEEYGSVMDL